MGCPVTDIRGEDIYEWVEINNFKIENTRHDPPTFDCSRGRSWIDLQLTKNVELQQRRVSEEESLSDHKHTSYTIIITSRKVITKKRFNIYRANWDQFKHEIGKWRGNRVENREQLETEIERFDTYCKKCCAKAIPLKKERRSQRENIWWNQELETKKKEVKTLRKRAQEERDQETRERKQQIYMERCNKYKKLIKTAKERFRQYIEDKGGGDPWGLPYRLINGSREEKMSSNMKKDDGTWTQNAI